MGHPVVSIGLPVYNGEQFLSRALDSILNQTYSDLELIISDNGSTDHTMEICRTYAAADKRIRYIRNEINRGAAWNFNNVFKLSSAKYFKWAAHDDICAPEFVAKCVDVLESDPGIVLCFCKTVQIDDQGHFEKKRDHIQLPNLGSPKAHERFRDIIARRHGCEAVFGIIRTDVLRQTPLIGNYMASDKVLLALLSTRGRFHELPDYLFFQREHRKRSVKGSDHEVTAWFDPKRGKEIVFPVWRISWEYFFVAVKGPARLYDRLCCLWEEAKWAIRNSRQFRWDLSSSVDRVLLLRGSRPIYCRLQNSLKRGRQTLPSWLITPIALALISTVEGFHWIFGTGDRSDRSDRTKM